MSPDRARGAPRARGPPTPGFCGRTCPRGLARTRSMTKPKRAHEHTNVMVGWTSKKHTARMKVTAQFGNVAITAGRLSAIGVYASTTGADANLTGLLQSLQNYWSENSIGDGVYPLTAPLALGSKVKLWAPGTHVDIGYAVGHPNLDGRARCAREGGGGRGGTAGFSRPSEVGQVKNAAAVNSWPGSVGQRIWSSVGFSSPTLFCSTVGQMTVIPAN